MGYVASGLGQGSGAHLQRSLGVPDIRRQPDDAIRDAGSTAVFGVEVSGAAPFSFRWRKDGSPLTEEDRIQGVATDLLKVRGVTGLDVGAYSVVVGNAWGSVTSRVGVLRVRFRRHRTTATLFPLSRRRERGRG